ncbi:hypothetical protein [Paraflavitalea sp. CAU 1676]|uniref:hypothetical protein n=1 Tax=Paraflavitalea sp. CAU 1676 TaxID=3032598 RepID=UPI0023DBA73D|nr:hypothetical protein [Paraflavitalea sp. CAU 1676]MDF2189208.1 hypothetical protein [Paraflavitalea sp. CAU 1676]
MNSLSFPVVHPSFQKLKHAGRLLHLTAGMLILVHAISHFQQPESSRIYLGCLLLMALDIFILVFAGKNILNDMPRVNLFFRLTEILFFLGIGITLLVEKQWLMGTVHLVLCSVYIYLFYCEKKAQSAEYVAIHHTGISVPGLPESKFFLWTHINGVDACYDSIRIETASSGSYEFDLRQNLAFEELDQIHEFCRHYLGAGR